MTRGADGFASLARDFLAERLDRNVLATVLINIVEGSGSNTAPLFAYCVDDGGVIRAAALRSPPHPLLVTELDEPLAYRLVRQWLPEDPELPGVTGLPATARAVAGAWAELTGGRAVCLMQEAMHTLTEVRGLERPAAGELRRASPTERVLLAGWLDAFAAEAGVTGTGQAEDVIDARIRSRQLLAWDAGGAVCLVVVHPAVAGVVRVGPVYTPPEYRRLGYATSAVAEASRRALAGGAHTCMLFTDLANPTSNKIYSDVGYVRIGDWEQYGFEPARTR